MRCVLPVLAQSRPDLLPETDTDAMIASVYDLRASLITKGVAKNLEVEACEKGKSGV